jgi:hypothetical protein
VFLFALSLAALSDRQICQAASMSGPTYRSVVSTAAKCSTFKGELLYAAWIHNPSSAVYAFDANASGETSPICEATSSDIGLDVGGITLDPALNLWIMNSAAATLMKFPKGTDGSSNPTQIISGASTLLSPFPFGNSQGVAADGAGDIWAPYWYDYNGLYGYVVAFAGSATGNVAPMATIGYADKGQEEQIAAPVSLVKSRVCCKFRSVDRVV